MLELKNNIFENVQETPREHYTFHLDSSDVVTIEKKYIGDMKKRMAIAIACSAFLAVYGILRSSPAFAGLGFGMLLMSLAAHIKVIRHYKKLYAKSRERYPKTLFDYTLYGDSLIVWISSDDAIRQFKVRLSEIKKAQIVKDIVVMEIEGQLFLMKKDELIENSYFLSICKKK